MLEFQTITILGGLILHGHGTKAECPHNWGLQKGSDMDCKLIVVTIVHDMQFCTLGDCGYNRRPYNHFLSQGVVLKSVRGVGVRQLGL